MEINIKELTKEEIIYFLKEFGAIVSKKDLPSGISPSLFLRDDLSLNLELMELALAYVVEFSNIVLIYDLDLYYKLRGIELDAKRRGEEGRFILGFCNAISNEHSERGPILVSYYDKNSQ